MRPEDVALAITLGLMMLLPILEIVLRKTISKGISNSPSIVQHLALIAGMVGGAIAARDDRLLTLGSAQALIPVKARDGARWISRVIAGLISALLCVASIQFVRNERTSAAMLAYSIPIWVIELVLPIGFALIAWRIVRGASKDWRWRIAAAVTVALLIVALANLPGDPRRYVVPAFVVLFIATL